MMVSETEIDANPASERNTRPTAWLSVGLAIGAGLLAAFQVGKVHIALPSIRESFPLTLFGASWLLSALSVVGLFLATLAGSFSAKIGTRLATIMGLVLIAIACGAGALAPTAGLLLWSRLFEGIGFVLVVVAAPSLIVELTNPRNIRVVLAVWAAYMPGGVALIAVLAPILLATHTWRAVWWANALALLVFAAICAVAIKRVPAPPSSRTHGQAISELRTVATSRGPLVLSLIFGMYTMQHLAVMGFMPTILHEKFGLSTAQAGLLVSIAMASNILGNLTAGVLLQRGIKRNVIIGAASIFMAIMSLGMFSLGLPMQGVYICSFLFSCVGGLVPSAVMGAAPFHSPSPSLLAATNGLLVQGSNLGIVVGPPLLSSVALGLGWQWVPLVTCTAAILATWMATMIYSTASSRPK